MALAENAVANGVHFFFRHPVTAIAPRFPGGYVVTAGGETFSARVVVNAAGLFSDRIAALAGVEGYRIYPCRGEYFILDQIAGDLLPLPVYPAPKAGAGGLGVHLTPTIHGNLLIGPSAEYIQSPEDTASTRPVMDQLFLQARQLLPALEKGQIIGGLRRSAAEAGPAGGGGLPGLCDPGRTSRDLSTWWALSPRGSPLRFPSPGGWRALVGGSLDLSPRRIFRAHRRGIRRFRDQSPAAQAALIAADPDYGEVVCRCQTVTRAELRQAVENPLGVRTLAESSTGLGHHRPVPGGLLPAQNCPDVGEDYGLAPEDVTYRGEGSPLFAGRVK